MRGIYSVHSNGFCNPLRISLGYQFNMFRGQTLGDAGNHFGEFKRQGGRSVRFGKYETISQFETRAPFPDFDKVRIDAFRHEAGND